MNRRSFLSFLGFAPLAAAPAMAGSTVDLPDILSLIQASEMAAGSRDLAMRRMVLTPGELRYMNCTIAECGPEGIIPLTRGADVKQSPNGCTYQRRAG